MRKSYLLDLQILQFWCHTAEESCVKYLLAGHLLCTNCHVPQFRNQTSTRHHVSSGDNERTLVVLRRK
jgi:hypothetical protein